jgi:predicted phosphodiesterase
VRIALISDIHGNLEALQTVLAEIDRQIDVKAGDRIWCLGDIIGYGPNPVECVELVAQRCEWSLLGNHDYAALYEPTNFNRAAEQAAHWTREQFEAVTQQDQARGARLWEFLGKLRVRVKEGPFLAVHGSPRKPINEYIFPEEGHNILYMQKIFDRFESICLVGHTHAPGVFTGDDFWKPTTPKSETESAKIRVFQGPDSLMLEQETEPEIGDTFSFHEGEKVIVNPGSVGQPRDLDCRASYAILEIEDKPKRVKFFRVPYDIEFVKAKIFSIEKLDNWLGERLTQGR